MMLVEEYGKTNIVAYKDLEKITRLSPSTKYPQTDAGWLAYMKELARWYDRSWNFEPGTTAHIYLRGGGVGADYVGRVVYVKDERILGFRSLSGGKNLPEYYRAMKKLGFYIP